MEPTQPEAMAERIERICQGDVRTIARVLSDIEGRDSSQLRPLLRELYSRAGHATVIGVTGSPGSGKSTLVAQMARHYREAGEKVGIIAVDPTSPFSGGAILGDRIRMQTLASDPGVFIRSMATRGQLGGLSAGVEDAVTVLDAAGYGILLIETVGVGQDEVDIVSTAHLTILVLMPGAGDGIQTIKAGVMEIADIFVLNKADYPETLRTERQLHSFLEMISREDGWRPALVKTVATSGSGVGDLLAAIERYRDAQKTAGSLSAHKKTLARQRLLTLVRDRILARILQSVDSETVDKLASAVAARDTDPDTVAKQLVRQAWPADEEE